jgi:hypothetical protein
MLGVIKAIRDTIVRFALASVEIDSDCLIGTKTINIPFTRKFFEGETIVIRNDTIGEVRVIDEIIDDNTMTITEDLERTWTVAEGAKVEKAPGGQYVKRIYLGDPDVIPDYPAITIVADGRDEEWWTLESTKVKWNCTISCIFEDDGFENSYEGMLELTKSIENALWANRWPVFGEIVRADLTADFSSGDQLVRVADTSKFKSGNQFMMEDYAGTLMGAIRRIIDSTTLEIEPAYCCHDFLVSRNAVILVPSRWVIYSYPSGSDYGYIHKGTLLKAGKITWSAEEEVVRRTCTSGPQII